MLTLREFPTFALPYISLILIEPSLVTKELYYAHIDDRKASMALRVNATSVRRDAWPTRDDAFNYFSKRLPWKIWDPRVVRLLSVSPTPY